MKSNIKKTIKIEKKNQNNFLFNIIFNYDGTR